ncbi:MAG: alpha/beta fold hydrolase [Arenibacterium sp.]
MAVFLLVHGAWHGGWCWEKTGAALRARGHEVHAPTLTGLGERSHLLSADITPDFHVQDIVNTLKWRDLTNVILVGHSYGGIVTNGVASQIPERLRALVYLDAFAPEESGVSLFAKANPTRMTAFKKQIEAGAIALKPDEAHKTWVEDPELRAWVLSKCTPHPKGCFEHGVTLTGRQSEVPHRHYILAAKNAHSPFQAEYTRVRDRPDWTSEVIQTWHDAMVEAPDDLAAMFDAYALKLDQQDAT